jgi:hypothetical protein
MISTGWLLVLTWVMSNQLHHASFPALANKVECERAVVALSLDMFDAGADEVKYLCVPPPKGG